ncbi:hypothetical protein [Bradyrhizobium sp. dw_411]|uniref:hypothetical protein n=1 Tax=Bradyrhizobium sp. dw_411 TaxID=2720082 RepID=UPI001BCBFB29|nr:hypothetical protein [Bradyrhizobium sp. dw_411]
MKKAIILIAMGALAFPAIAFAQTASNKAAPSREVKRPAPVWDAWGGVLRQDLYDRNNPNNLRSDWPSPPRQAGSI